ncbi:MAG: membrane-bound PQQ-dependent dehydrogenase, glucose/quinate/shikimate family [Novosphingobium sp.]|nr:membrane-bound PQQ-dependent dehydrogenase, glucose/quinate/shikimate family [Novosphingobium sp.]
MLAMLGKVLTWLLVLGMGAAGLALLLGGVQLVAAGGSFYYVLSGGALALSAYGLARSRRWWLPLYGALLGGTLIWALGEAGLDGWALVPRVIAPAVLGLILLVPAVRARAKPSSSAWLTLPLVATVIIFVAAGTLGREPYPEFDGTEPVTVADEQDGEWRNWGRSLSGERFSPLADIAASNVGKLEQAWEFVSDVEPYGFHSFEATPIAAGGKLFTCLDRDVIVALDQDSGEQLWKYDAKPDLEGVFAANCRGVSYYLAPEPAEECQARILFGVHDNRLMALDAETGKLCESFGDKGAIDLREGLGDFPKGIAFPTSPPALVGGLAVIGGWVTDGLDTDEPSGVIRAFDAVTGELAWAWDYGRDDDPTKELAEGETYTRSAPNAWGVFSGDEALGLVYIPTGVSTPDYFGAHRTPGSEIHATGVVALDIATGKSRWHFQTIHHDIWDLDVASQPVLTGIEHDGRKVPALIQPTKRGEFFVLDRRDGKPVYPVKERPVPQNVVEGEWASDTQPYSSFPNVGGAVLREVDMWGVTPLDQMWCRLQFRKFEYQGEFTPPSENWAIFYPGSAGGSNWGSVTVDPVRGLMVSNSLYMADIGKMIPRAEVEAMKYADGTTSESFAFIQEGTPFAIDRRVFLNPLGVPCQEPPYGRLTVIDLKTGKKRWSLPFGTAKHAGPMGLSSFLPIRMGSPNLGGSLATAGGLIFIGAAQDRQFRAIDIGNGRELWSTELPAIGGATPMTYRSAKTGKQYVVIAAGGHPGLPGPSGGSLMAYALPEGE